jgi:hypothetical protein
MRKQKFASEIFRHKSPHDYAASQNEYQGSPAFGSKQREINDFRVAWDEAKDDLIGTGHRRLRIKKL